MEILTDTIAQPLSAWHEELGGCLWWLFPIQEGPYVGSPLDSDWPFDEDDQPFFTPVPIPANPDGDGHV